MKNYNRDDLNKLLKDNPEELMNIILDFQDNKKYGLVWEEDKPLETKLPMLEEIKDREIREDISKPTNLLIEGDNYYSLSLLQKTHKNKIDVIYMDPPYNTGSKDFIYNDKYVDKEDTYEHSKWLDFMSKRIKLATELLTDLGFLLISIDENEYAQLKLLCDEIMGSENYVTTFCWVATTQDLSEYNNENKILTLGSNLKMFKNSYEYVLCYRKTKQAQFNLINTEYTFTVDRLTKTGNKISTITFPKGLKAETNLTKTFKNKVGGKREEIRILNKEGIIFKDGILQNDVYLESCFCIPNMVNKFLNDEKVLDRKGQEVLEIFFTNTGIPKMKKEKKGTIPTNILSGYGNTSKWKKELNDMLCMENTFDYPKPYPLIIDLLKICSNKNSTVLDCFARSGTTGESVLRLNKEDNGQRQFILCTNNENNICEKVTYERVKRVINGYITPKGKKNNGVGGNLKYYKCTFLEKE